MSQEQVAGQDQELGDVNSPIQKENMIPQSKVDEIVHRRTASVAEKTRKEVLDEVSRSQGGQSMGGISQPSHEELMRKIASEEAHKHFQDLNNKHEQDVHEQNRKQLVSNFVGKIEAAKSKYPDLDKKLAKLPLAKMDHILHMANSMDNTAEIMNDLADNPNKIGNLHAQFSMSPELAYETMGKLSQSIKDNDSASQVKTANEPLSQITPSTVGTDNGSMSVSDLRKQPWLKA